AHRPALGFERVEQVRTAPAFLDRGELPRQVDRIADTGVHAKAAGGRHHVRGVAEDKAPAVAVTIRHQLAAHPGHDAENLVVEVDADGAADGGVDLVGGELALRGAADDREAPLVAAVDSHDGGPGALGTDDDEAIGPALVMQREEVRTTEDDVGGVGERRVAAHGDVERLAHHAAAAVAAGNVACPDIGAAAA